MAVNQKRALIGMAVPGQDQVTPYDSSIGRAFSRICIIVIPSQSCVSPWYKGGWCQKAMIQGCVVASRSVFQPGQHGATGATVSFVGLQADKMYLPVIKE